MSELGAVFVSASVILLWFSVLGLQSRMRSVEKRMSDVDGLVDKNGKPV